MKKIATLLVLLSVLFSFSACGSDDDDDIDKNTLVGTWTADSATLDKISSNNSSYDKALKEAIKKGNYSKIGTGVTFKEDGTFVMFELGEETESGTYTIQGNKVIIVSDKEEGVLYWKNNRLKFTEVASDDDLEIINNEYNSIGYEVYSLTMTMYFKK